MYSSTISLILVLHGVGGQHHGPAALSPPKKPVPIEKEGRVSPRAVLDRCEKTQPQRIRASDRPAIPTELSRLHLTK
jgi:hypothetical protein